MKRDYYELLGVSRDADERDIKRSFRKLARELHPDVNQHDPDAEEKFKEAAEAYEVLCDAERRSVYDRYGHEGLQSSGFHSNFQGFGSFSDIFDAFFGGDPLFGGGGVGGSALQGGDVAAAVEISLDDAAAGVSVDVEYDVVDRCKHCHGNGAEPGTPIETCARCGARASFARSAARRSASWCATWCATPAAATGAWPRRRARSAAGAGVRRRGDSSPSTCRRASRTTSASAWAAAATRASAAGRPATCTCWSA